MSESLDPSPNLSASKGLEGPSPATPFTQGAACPSESLQAYSSHTFLSLTEDSSCAGQKSYISMIWTPRKPRSSFLPTWGLDGINNRHSLSFFNQRTYLNLAIFSFASKSKIIPLLWKLMEKQWKSANIIQPLISPVSSQLERNMSKRDLLGLGICIQTSCFPKGPLHASLKGWGWKSAWTKEFFFQNSPSVVEDSGYTFVT